MNSYNPEQWRDFFITVGGGAAALSGLAVVAMSMHLEAIASDPILRHRARMILVSLAAVFIRCSLALVNLGARALAVDLIVTCVAVFVIAIRSYAPVSKLRSPHHVSLMRTLGSTACYVVEVIGAALLFYGLGWGLVVAAYAMVANFLYVISGCWLLLLGIRRDEIPRAPRA